MSSVIDDDFMVCTDCLMIIANDDASGLDSELGGKKPHIHIITLPA